LDRRIFELPALAFGKPGEEHTPSFLGPSEVRGGESIIEEYNEIA